MTRPARFSQQARREIAAALRGMEHAGAQQALRLALEAAARRLGAHSFYGRAAPPHLPEPYRFWSLPRFGYLLVYDPETDPVEILRFVYTRQTCRGRLPTCGKAERFRATLRPGNAVPTGPEKPSGSVITS